MGDGVDGLELLAAMGAIIFMALIALWGVLSPDSLEVFRPHVFVVRVQAAPKVVTAREGSAVALFGEGKGGGVASMEEKRTYVLRARLVSVPERVSGLYPGQEVVLTTEDSRVLALPVGSEAAFRCYYLDGTFKGCRLASPAYAR